MRAEIMLIASHAMLDSDSALHHLHRLISGIPGLTRASNDNFACREQYAFEQAVMRELSGDVDF